VASVLLVEAEHDLMQRMGWILLEAGFITARVPLSTDVPAKIESFTPDVIVMNNDALDPERERMIRRLRSYVPQVRIIDVHAAAAAHRGDAPHACGADEYLHLPFDADDLVGCVRRLLDE
jgi:two-component system, OmpR family, phosphate regulon response regulator OmpR